MRARTVFVVALLLCAGCADVSTNDEGPSDTNTPQASRTVPEGTTEERTITGGFETSPDMAALQLRLEELAATSGGRVSVVVRGLEGYPAGTEATVGGGEVFRSASVIKVLILTELLSEVDSGDISLDEPLAGGTVETNARAMISTSDNTATNVLIERLGGFAPVNSLAAEIGLTDTILQRYMLDTDAAARGEENYTSATDTADLLAEIHSEDGILSPTSREYALSLLGAQQLNTKIPAGLPPSTQTLHKTGELDGIEHDAAIIITPDGKSFVLVALTEGDAPSNISVIREAARISYDAMATAQ